MIIFVSVSMFDHKPERCPFGPSLWPDSACRLGPATPLSVTWQHSPEMLADLRFHLSWLLISSCVFSRSGGTETELADLRPLVAPEENSPAVRE
jgi:hypothetical protein